MANLAPTIVVTNRSKVSAFARPARLSSSMSKVRCAGFTGRNSFSHYHGKQCMASKAATLELGQNEVRNSVDEHPSAVDELRSAGEKIAQEAVARDYTWRPSLVDKYGKPGHRISLQETRCAASMRRPGHWSESPTPLPCHSESLNASAVPFRNDFKRSATLLSPAQIAVLQENACEYRRPRPIASFGRPFAAHQIRKLVERGDRRC